MSAPNPVSTLEHAHDQAVQLAIKIGRLLRAPAGPTPDPTRETKLATLLEQLRDELLEHFANEEEGLFPFIRKSLPETAALVDRLEAAHDGICGSVVRLVHLASRGAQSSDALALYERFESAYGAHSREEAELFMTLADRLNAELQRELSELLRGLR